MPCISSCRSRLEQTMSAVGAQVTTSPIHQQYMQLALLEAQKCVATPTAFCVGAVIVSSSTPPRVLSTGYSRELPGNTHAEQCAIDKLISSHADPVQAAALLEGASIYTTMEPCSVRLSGNVPCVERVMGARFGMVYMGVEEPSDFVECEGTRKLKESGAGVWVVEGPGLREACLKEARRGHDGV
jgi:pyrimidine deaminase RibD-like protein